MSDYIIAIDRVDDVWQNDPELPEYNPPPHTAVPLIGQTVTDKVAYLTQTIEGFPASMIIVGEWDRYTGEPLRAITDDYQTWIRPLGNKDGIATTELLSHIYVGHSLRKYFEYEATPNPDPEAPQVRVELYPESNRPFSLLVERQLITDDGYPHIPHGWKVTMVSADPLRDIQARAIGIYSDPECTQYLYTTGAFVADGDTFSTVCPVGQRSADEQPIYFALLLGSAQEGIWNMPIGKAEDTREFWKTDQGGSGAGEYEDTGMTVTGMAGTVTLIQDNSGFNVGDEIRIDGHESALTSKWTGVGLVLTPYKAHTTGQAVFKK